jgi:hypothetical protein
MSRRTRSFKEKAVSVLEKAERLKKTDRARTTFEPGPDHGDRLARGAASVTFRMPDVSQEQWDRVFLTAKEFFRKYGRKP